MFRIIRLQIVLLRVCFVTTGIGRGPWHRKISIPWKGIREVLLQRGRGPVLQQAQACLGYAVVQIVFALSLNSGILTCSRDSESMGVECSTLGWPGSWLIGPLLWNEPG